MIQQNELTDIYDGGMGTDDPIPKPKVVGKFKEGVTPVAGASTPVQHTSGVDVNAYREKLPGGVYDYQDIDRLRGENQSAWDKWGNMAAGIIPKIGTSFLEGVGYLGALATEWQDGRDYSNGLTEWAKDPLGHWPWWVAPSRRASL